MRFAMRKVFNHGGSSAGVPARRFNPGGSAKLVGATYGVPGLKAALNLLGYAGGVPRPPLQPVSEPAIAQIREQLEELKLLEAARA